MFVWNIDPDFFHLPAFLGGRGIRYYGVLYAFALMGGFYWWQWQIVRSGRTKELAERFLTVGVIAVIVGARLGHCLFYEPERYLADPISILKFWEGGLASHGTTVALLIVLVWFARKYAMTIREVLDRIALSVAWAATLVRVGNFMNSEIVGRATDVSWAVKFPRHDRRLLTECPGECGRVAKSLCGTINERCYGFAEIPWRHPSQLYEALMGVAIFVLLWAVDRKYGERRPLGLIGSLFLLLYFSGRFTVEFVKEFQTLEAEQSALTMGQYLSIPFIVIGAFGVFKSLKDKTPTVDYTPAGAAAKVSE